MFTTVHQSLDPSERRNSQEDTGVNLSDDRYRLKSAAHALLRVRAASRLINERQPRTSFKPISSPNTDTDRLIK